MRDPWDGIGYPGEFVHGDDVYIDDFYTNERWLPAKGFADRYWISTHGRIWSTREHRFVYGSPCNNYGHIDVSLRDHNGERVRRYMHRLVAEAFIPNPNGYPEVLHGDDDPSNNCVWNLRWGTQLHNNHDAIDRGRFRFFSDEDRELAMQKRRMAINARNLKTGEIRAFRSQCEASRILGVHQSDIYKVISRKKTHVNDWSFVKQGEEFGDLSHVDLHRHAKCPLIRATNIHTGESEVYLGLTSAADCLEMSIASISNVLRGKQRSAKGWTFEYVEEDD